MGNSAGRVLTLAAALLAPGAAQACTVGFMVADEPAQRERDARAAYYKAAAIIDGEVVRPLVYRADGTSQPALVRAVRVRKGPRQEYFKVGDREFCDDRVPGDPGQRDRMVLVGGPDVYYWAADDESYVDRLLGSDRRSQWPYRAGKAPARP